VSASALVAKEGTVVDSLWIYRIPRRPKTARSNMIIKVTVALISVKTSDTMKLTRDMTMPIGAPLEALKGKGRVTLSPVIS
jgi:hypothetical protein